MGGTRERATTAGRPAASILLSLLATAAAAAAPVAGQGFCFRGQPLEACSGFLLADFHGHYAVAENGRERIDTHPILGPDGDLVMGRSLQRLEGFTWALGADLGYARNVSPSWALGGTLGVEGVEGGPRVVLKLRARRWLGSGFALDVVPGVFVLEDIRGRGDDRVPGGLLGARLDLAGLGFLSLRWEAMELQPDVFEIGDTKRVDPGGFQHALSAGAGVGSQAGLTAFILAGVLFVALLASVGPVA